MASYSTSRHLGGCITNHSSGLGDTSVVRVKVSTHLKRTSHSPLSLVR
jgi:hypothetical protein